MINILLLHIYLLCFENIFRHDKNNYFSEIHTKGLTVVALDMKALKELTKDNLCESVSNGSADQTASVKTKLDTANGDDYLPSPKSLIANSSIEFSHDIAQLENCINVIEECIANSFDSTQPKEVLSLKGRNECGIELNGLHNVSLESLDSENTQLNSSRNDNKSPVIVNGHSSPNGDIHAKNGCLESTQLEKISIHDSKSVSDIVLRNKIPSENKHIGKSLPSVEANSLLTKSNQTTSVNRTQEANKYKTTMICNGTGHSLTTTQYQTEHQKTKCQKKTSCKW